MLFGYNGEHFYRLMLIDFESVIPDKGVKVSGFCLLLKMEI